MEHTQAHNEQHTAHDEGAHSAHTTKANILGHASSLEVWLVRIFAQAPHLPPGGKKVVSDIIPWLCIVFGILGIIGLLSLGGLSMWASPFMALGGLFHSINLLLTFVLGFVSSILTFVAFNPLLAKKKRGWDYAFYGLIVSALSTVIHLVFMYGGLGSILGIIIGAYLLFEIRDMYN